MRKIVAFIVQTVDGYYEGPNGEFDWPNVDEEFKEFSVEHTASFDALRMSLRLTDARVFRSGNVLLTYEPEAADET